MNKLFLIVIFPVFIFAINWKYNLKEAINIASKENKNILVFVESKHCPYCQKMKSEIFNNKDTSKILEKDYILVKMDINQANKIFPGTYITPTTYIFTPEKELLASQVGYENEEFFFWTLGDAERKLKELKSKK